MRKAERDAMVRRLKEVVTTCRDLGEGDSVQVIKGGRKDYLIE